MSMLRKTRNKFAYADMSAQLYITLQSNNER